jgi:hypothetical protein
MTPALAASSTAWITRWTLADPLPPGEAAKLPAYLAAAEQHAAPASTEAFAVAMKPLVDWVQVFGPALEPSEQDGGRPGVRRAQIADIVRGYREPLADLPGDLLADAVKTVVARHRYRNLPNPGEIRAHAEDLLRERNDRLRRLRTAAMKAQMEAASRPDDTPRERTPEQIAEAERMAAEAKRVLAEAKPQAIPGTPADLKPEDTDYRAACRRVAEETKSFRRIPKPWDRPQVKDTAA